MICRPFLFAGHTAIAWANRGPGSWKLSSASVPMERASVINLCSSLTPQITLRRKASPHLARTNTLLALTPPPFFLLGCFRSFWEKSWSPLTLNSSHQIASKTVSIFPEELSRSQYWSCGTAAFTRQVRKANHCDVVSKKSQRVIRIAQMIQKTNGC